MIDLFTPPLEDQGDPTGFKDGANDVVFSAGPEQAFEPWELFDPQPSEDSEDHVDNILSEGFFERLLKCVHSANLSRP